MAILWFGARLKWENGGVMQSKEVWKQGQIRGEGVRFGFGHC